MKRILIISFLTVLVAAGSLARAQAPADGTLNLFYLGNRASRLEPCGCHSRQQGGVQFEAALYDQRAAAPSLRLDLGGWTSFQVNQSPVELLLTRYVLRSMAMLRMDAANVAPRDIELTEKFLREFMDQYPAQTPPLISANVFAKAAPDKPAFAPYRIVKRQVGATTVTVGITGVCWLFDEDLPKPPAGVTQRETIDYIAREPLKCLEPVFAELRPKVDLLIVLSSGEVGSAVEIARAFPKADLVLAQNAIEAPQTASQQEGAVRLLFGRNVQGREVGFAPLARKDGQWVFQAPPEYLAVAKDVTPKAEFLALIEEFKQDTRTLKPKRPPKNVKEVYAGAIRCELCHEKETAAWKKTPHARAIDTLVSKGQQFNPSCLKCHVTGFEESNGFYSIDNDRKMTNVQCEMCHGPGLVHFNAQYRKKAGGTDAEALKKIMEEEAAARPHKAVPEKTCVTCHTKENDDQWDYQKKLPMVKH